MVQWFQKSGVWKASREVVAKAVRHVDNIVHMFDEGAAAAVDNYQMTVATDEKTKISENIEKTSHSQEKRRQQNMQHNEQKQRKGPSPEEIQKIKAQWKALDSDPEYQKRWKKIQADIQKIALFNDSIEMKTR